MIEKEIGIMVFGFEIFSQVAQSSTSLARVAKDDKTSSY